MKSQTDFKQGNLTIETSVIVFHRVAFTLYRLDFNLEQDLTVAAFIEFAAQGFSKKFEVEFPGGGEHL